ncbi:uncharacterized protein LOC113506941 isoform X1 [Trichoplusia ni]|uniref:Uncharacterized protein LOC113498027 isoform X1 n=1 Tax=Trichoplusia ni TaxID=7111 RepID=A0A7E5WXL0_TRINI|nr:uncharacterized protein LOC113498027 isoform X1 [Trichoplusia ni]XP_026745583.1 uncharacterized protein LOC113506941 isoform X1 [Trichoplusia ni]
MVFKLIRIDDQCSSSKIQLSTGVHVIGRGKFLHNDDTDKRVSRNHAELEVTDDAVTLKALHQNPCFFIKKDTDKKELLQQDCTVSLYHGDRFGLIPNHFWYEVLNCPSQGGEETPIVDEVTKEVRIKEARDVGASETEENSADTRDSAKDSEETIQFENNEEDADQNCSCSPSIMNNDQEPTEEYEVPLDPDAKTPLKRSNSFRETSPIDVKKVKTEPDDGVDTGASVAGPSNGQASSDSDSKDKDDASPAKPDRPARERCLYGANCYSSVKITRPTQIQLEKLVDFLEKNPGLARGNMRSVQARRQTKIKWEQVAISLNALGGAIKDARSWTKFWCDKKYALKKSVAQRNASANRPGGGVDLSPFSELDERLLTLIGENSFAESGDQESGIHPNVTMESRGPSTSQNPLPSYDIRAEQPIVDRLPSLTPDLSDTAASASSPRRRSPKLRLRQVRPTNALRQLRAERERLMKMEGKKVETELKKSAGLDKLVQSLDNLANAIMVSGDKIAAALRSRP